MQCAGQGGFKTWNTVLDMFVVCFLSVAVVMIHWTRQIKEVLNAQETVEMGDSSGPLEEIAFWRSRCVDLSGISQQLQKAGVCHIQAILQQSKSSYVPPFCKLAKQIQVQKRECVCACVNVCICVC